MTMQKSKFISFACPSCNEEYEIFLKEIPYLLLIQCPNCTSRLVYFDGAVKITNDELDKKIEKAQKLEDLKDIIKNHNSKHKKLENDSKKKKFEGIKKVISEDDILNLKISLENCKTFDDFMRLLDGTSKQ